MDAAYIYGPDAARLPPTVAAVEALHHADSIGYCDECSGLGDIAIPYPCGTVRALAEHTPTTTTGDTHA
jgi:hypothetical protein